MRITFLALVLASCFAKSDADDYSDYKNPEYAKSYFKAFSAADKACNRKHPLPKELTASLTLSGPRAWVSETIDGITYTHLITQSHKGVIYVNSDMVKFVNKEEFGKIAAEVDDLKKKAFAARDACHKEEMEKLRAPERLD